MAKSTSKITGATAKTSTAKTGTSNPKATKLKAVAKSVGKSPQKTTPEAALPKVVTVSSPVVNEPELKKKELIGLVVARSGIKKKDAKPVVEAVLAILGETISDGRELNLQPLGKLRINRVQEKPNGRVIICKLRQSMSVKTSPTDPISQTAE